MLSTDQIATVIDMLICRHCRSRLPDPFHQCHWTIFSVPDAEDIFNACVLHGRRLEESSESLFSDITSAFERCSRNPSRNRKEIVRIYEGLLEDLERIKNDPIERS